MLLLLWSCAIGTGLLVLPILGCTRESIYTSCPRSSHFSTCDFSLWYPHPSEFTTASFLLNTIFFAKCFSLWKLAAVAGGRGLESNRHLREQLLEVVLGGKDGGPLLVPGLDLCALDVDTHLHYPHAGAVRGAHEGAVAEGVEHHGDVLAALAARAREQYLVGRPRLVREEGVHLRADVAVGAVHDLPG